MIGTLFNPITLLLATMALQWVSLGEVGAFTLLVPYLTLALAAGYPLLFPRGWRAVFDYIKSNAIWMAPLALYLIMVIPILEGTPAANTSARQLFYLLCGIGLAAGIAISRNLPKTFRLGSILGIAVFVIFVEVLAGRIGLSWATAASQLFFNGNLEFVFYSFFNSTFNSLADSADALVNASRKNDVAGCILVLLLLFRSASKTPDRDLWGAIFTAGTLALLVMLNDRSVLISAAICLSLAMAVAAKIRPSTSTVLLLIKIFGALALFALALGTIPPEAGFLSALSERMSFNDLSTDSRLDQYAGAVDLINRHPFTGSGYMQVDGYYIHNVFLAAWVYAGVFAFILVLFFYLILLVRWSAFIKGLLTRPATWVLPLAPEWIAGLMVMPLFRVWISGEGGVMKFAEWVAVSLFLGCVLANRWALRRIAQVRAHHADRIWERHTSAAPVQARTLPTTARSSVARRPRR